MTDELALKYKELKENEAEKKKKKKLKKKQTIKAVGNAIQISILIVLGLLLLLIVVVETSDVDINSTSPSSSNRTPSKWKKERQRRIERRTSAGVPIERGADIDYRIDSDKLIDLSVKQIRSNGYRCNSLSSIDLYNYNKSIVVRCNEGKDKYRIYPSSGQVTRE
ncbi:MAG: hypothetical protein OXE42_11150 [Gammaproteobacteria bacterium]|nr:hypothetical protein [Gammaproteobacteria bacterium]